ncbi:AfsA-related hotdog domain-containing protein [Nocardia sp. BMG51109]|uniref:AfsA-related hotdog domain-containing protein n=1 Tax=Nocardia sp. BMG51109 TaxID=1056816 RepID=UPI00046435E0|nr:AfsA-related hotdog domain-containing protein [Nocardia sp. BMG51109]
MSQATETMLSFERTVPCSLAHRRALGEVFVADTSTDGSEGFLAAIQIPRAHSLYFDRLVDYHDPLSTVEAIRQAMIVVGHRYLNVPQNTPASLQQLDFEVEDLSVFRDTGNAPLEGIVRAHAGMFDSFGDAAGTFFEAQLTIAGSQAMTLRGSGIQFPADTYREIRALQQDNRPGVDAPAEPVQRVAPEQVGRRDPRNVVVGTTERGFSLVIDQRHPSFFDHAYDHVPGPLLIEGYRQAAVVAAARAGFLASPVAAVLGCEATFSGFAELGAPVELTAEPEADPDTDGARVALGVHQFGARIAGCRIELAPYPAGA